MLTVVRGPIGSLKEHLWAGTFRLMEHKPTWFTRGLDMPGPAQTDIGDSIKCGVWSGRFILYRVVCFGTVLMA